MRAVTLLVRPSGEVSQAFIRRVPCPQGSGFGALGERTQSIPCAGNLLCHGGTVLTAPPKQCTKYIINSGLQTKTYKNSRPQTCPGSLNRNCRYGIQIYGEARKI